MSDRKSPTVEELARDCAAWLGAGGWRLDLDRREWHLSPEAQSLVGASAPGPHPLGDFLETLGVADAEALEGAFAHARARGAAVRVPVHRRKPDGTLQRLLMAGGPVFEGGGAELRGVIQDISAREEADPETWVQAAVFHSTADGIAFVDRDYRYVAVNPAYERYLGQPRSALVGRTVAESRGEALFQAVIQPRLDRCLAGERVTYETWADCPGRGRRLVRVTYDPHRDAAGAVIGVVAQTQDATAEAEIQAQRHETEARLQGLVANLPGVLFRFILDPDGSPAIDFLSPGARRLFPVADSELADVQALFETVPPGARAALWASLEDSARDLTPWSQDFPVIDKAGGERWLRGRSQPERDGEGRVVWDGVVIDITAEKQAEVALRYQTELRQQLVQLATPLIQASGAVAGPSIQDALAELGRFLGADRVSVFRCDSPGGGVMLCQEWCAPGVRGYGRADGVALDELAVVFQRHRDGQILSVNRTDATVDTAEHRVLTQRGVHGLLSIPVFQGVGRSGCLAFEFRQHTHELADGEPELLTLFAQWIIQRELREEAEIALRDSESRFRLLVDPLTVLAVRGCDLDGRLVYWNAGAERLYGYDRDEAIGQDSVELLVPADHRATVRAAMTHMAASGESPSPQELELVARDGRRIPVYTVHTVVRRVAHPPELFCLDVDLTEFKRAQAEREALQQRSAGAQRMESVGRLAGGIAHDFNNMLHVMLIHAELGREAIAETHPLAEHLAAIQEAAERSATLTQQVLTFSRRQPTDPQWLDLNQHIRSLSSLLERLIGETITLHCQPASGLPPVWMDPAQLDQLLTNLVVNARDALAEGGHITLTTDAGWFETIAGSPSWFQPGYYIRLAVCDDGVGMDPAVQERVFEPFYSTKPAGVGTGLGLATVYGVVKQQGGYITLDSEPGRGTCFWIYLAAQPAGGPPAIPAESDSSEGVRLDRVVVLWVEDEASVRVATTRSLEAVGADVHAVGSPLEALRWLDTQALPPDLLVTDGVMPEMNGLELIEAVQARYPQLPCLLLSGYPTDTFAGESEVPVPFLAKPCSSEALQSKLAALLRRDRGDPLEPGGT